MYSTSDLINAVVFLFTTWVILSSIFDPNEKLIGICLFSITVFLPFFVSISEAIDSKSYTAKYGYMKGLLLFEKLNIFS